LNRWKVIDPNSRRRKIALLREKKKLGLEKLEIQHGENARQPSLACSQKSPEQCYIIFFSLHLIKIKARCFADFCHGKQLAL
jgi:hypothetical protein